MSSVVSLQHYPNFQDKKYAIDVSNACYLQKDAKHKPKIEVFERIVEHLEELGVAPESIVGFSDSNFKYKVNNPYKYRTLVKRNAIVETPAGIKADQCMISFALRDEDVLLVTNDLLRDYYSSLPRTDWIAEKRITVTMITGLIFLTPMLKESISRRGERDSSRNITTLDVLETIKRSGGQFDLY